MTEPTFGMTFIRDDSEPVSVVPSDLSVVGLTLPSADADPSVFPYHVPVAFNSSDLAYLSKLGTGPAYRAVVKINAQLAPLQLAARIVLTRTPQGATIDETIANIVGDPGAGTGWFAMLQAGQRLGVIPRLLGSPGFTGRFTRTGGTTTVASAVKSGGNAGNGTLTLAGAPAYGGDVKRGIYQVRCIGGAYAASVAPKAGGNTGNGTVNGLAIGAGVAPGVYTVTCFAAAANGGTFVIENPSGQTIGAVSVGQAYNGPVVFTIADGSADFALGDQFLITVAPSVPANGGVFSVKDPDGVLLANATVGQAYNGSHIRFTIADGATDYAVGDGFDVTVGMVGGVAQANPICAVLPQINNALLAMAFVGGPGTTLQDALDWRETINSETMIPLDNWDVVRIGTSDVEEDGACVAIGQQVATDFENGGIPSHAPANRPVQGIIGLKRYDSFSLVTGATDGQILLSHQIGITQRGELGLETAISDSGFVLICTDTAASDPKWRMINVCRLRTYEHLSLLKATRHRLGRTNITRHGIQAVLNDHIALLSDWQAKGIILPGWSVGFEEDKNNPENLRLGRIRSFYRAEEPPTFKHGTIDSRRNRESLSLLIKDLVTSTDQLLGRAA
jgi:hypothetical protein